MNSGTLLSLLTTKLTQHQSVCLEKKAVKLYHGEQDSFLLTPLTLGAEVREDLCDVLVVKDLLTFWPPAIKGSQQALVYSPTGQKETAPCGAGAPLGTRTRVRHAGEVKDT